MKIYIKLFLSCLLTFSLCSQAPAQKVRLYGKLHAYPGAKTLELVYNGAACEIGNGKNIFLRVDAAGKFDTTLNISKPEYYKIVRNTLYLTPGDEIECQIYAQADSSSFKGKGSDVCNYLINRPFPKAGSFLEAGKNALGEFTLSRKRILEIANQRLNELEQLKQTYPHFVKLEQARVYADILNSYLAYPSYAKEYRAYSQEQKNRVTDSLFASLKEEMHSYLQQINQDMFTDLEVVRDVISKSQTYLPEYWQNNILAPEFSALRNIRKVISGLNYEVNTENLNQAEKLLSSVKNPEYRSIIEKTIQTSMSLAAGSRAPDFNMATPDGKIVKLSDFKGKVIYLDIWATWCGPCIGEAPYFEKLAEKFAGTDIVFIPVSTDNPKEIWISYLKEHHKKLPQYITLGDDLKVNWKIAGIPRFILIDKDFRIIDANASRPSNPKTEQILHALLDK